MAHILVVEDHPANLDLIGYVLKAFGHSLHTASDGQTALDLIRDIDFDLVLCDVQLPGIDGCEVARRLKADPRRRLTPIVAVTASAMVGDRERIQAAGFDGYLPKPFDPDTLMDRVNDFLGRGRAHGDDPGRR